MKCIKKLSKRIVKILIFIGLIEAVPNADDETGITSSGSDSSLY